MRVMQAFRFELDPNGRVRVALAKHVGAARFAYNWGLARCLEAIEHGARLIIAPRDFPSTRSCSRCGALGPRLSLSRRAFWCLACGFEADLLTPR